MDNSTHEFQRSFEVGPRARLTLKNIRGRVDVRADQAGVISVTAVRHEKSGDARRTVVRLEQDDSGRVWAVTDFDSGWHGQPCRVDYSVRVPPECDLDLSLVSASGALQGLHGDLRLRTVSGGLLLRGLSGRLNLGTVSGSVTATGLHLDEALELDTVSGDVSLADSNLPGIHAKMVSGSLDAATPLGAGPYHFKSVSGDVRLLLPAPAGLSVRLTTLSGTVHSNLARSRQVKGPGRVEAHLGPTNDSDASVQMSSLSGSLWLLAEGGHGQAEALEPAMAVGPQEPMPMPMPAPGPYGPPRPPSPATPDSPAAPGPRDILERVDRGELSVDEALEALRA
jgi:hypothetical protein